MDFLEGEEFKKEFKKLAKKYRSLDDDLAIAKKAIAASPNGNGAKHWNVLKRDGDRTFVMKMRMMCRAVKGAQFRLIYTYDDVRVEVVLIEVYFKSDNKERENKIRVDEYFKMMSKDDT